MKRIRMSNWKRRSRQAIAYILIVSLMLGLIPQSAYATSAISTMVEKEYTSEGCTITYKETSTWGNYVNADIVIKNNTDSDKSLWQLRMVYDGVIENIWNADIVSSENGIYQFAAKTYNSTIAAGQTVSFGFTAYGTESKPAVPETITYVIESASNSNGNSGETGDGESSTEEGNTGDGGTTEGGSALGQDYGILEQWKGLNYAMFTSGDEKLSLYTNTTNITGSVHTNQDFFYQGNTLTIDGVLEASKGITLKTSSGEDSQNIDSKLENAETIAMPDITKELYAYVKENGTIYDSNKEFNSGNVVIDTPIAIDGTASFHTTTFLGKGIIYATDSVTYNVGTLATPEDSRVFVASENGNITLNGSDISLNAVLYAPNGCVYINANSVNINGRIVAKQICINGTTININAGPYDLEMLDFLLKTEIDITAVGNQKENRKVVLTLDSLTEAGSISSDNVEWSITKNGANVSEYYAIDEESSSAFCKEMIFKEAGTYTVTATATTGSGVYTASKELVVTEDLAPVAGLTLESDYYSRNEEGKASISLCDNSFSPDGDNIGQRIWILYYDENNDGVFEENEGRILSDGNETEVSYETENVGRYKVFLEVIETFTDTIPKLLAEDAFRKDDTSDLSETNCVFEVGNEPPTAHLSIEKSKSADIVFTVGDVNSETLESYKQKAENLETILTEQGIDAKIDTVSTSTLTAQDTFAWKEYDHYNYEDKHLPTLEKHIVYEGDSIKMLGYSKKAIKDFLYVADDNPGQKIFEFDLQRDNNNWHSMEGGGFLFNTTVDEEANTIKGFCILVSQSGLKLVRIDCNNLTKFRDGAYSTVSSAGKLLKKFKMSNLYDKHHFKIVVDYKTISIWDGDTLIVEDYVLPENDYGYGFGPIISHSNHDCDQQSYFTFENITMQTMTGSSLSDIVDGYEWRPGASHYVVNLSNKEVPELSTGEDTADLAAALIANDAAFVGIGNENNENQYKSLLNAIQTGGMYLEIGDLAGTMDQTNDYIAASILAKDYSIGDYITTDDIVTYKGYYQDAEHDELYEQQWEYEYDPSVFGTGEAEHIVRNESEPITVFEDTGAYAIRLKVRDNPVGDNDDLDSYRLWSGTEEYEKLLVVESRPVASVLVQVSENASDKTTCIANVMYSAEDPDHPEDSTKGIRQEFFWYKNVKDADWTEGKLPNKLTVGETYLVKYQVKDIEGTLSFPATASVKTRDFLVYEEEEDLIAPVVFVDAPKQEMSVGEQMYVDVYATDDYGVENFKVYVNGELQLESFGRILLTGQEEGTITIKATATDIGGNTADKEITIKVTDDRDKTAPTAVITAPSAGSEIGFNVQIKGSAKDETEFAKYTLSYKEQSEEDYHTFHENTNPVSDDILGSLDITEFADGIYEILLTAEDVAGNIAYYGIMLYIETGVTKGYALVGELAEVTLNEDGSQIEIKGTATAQGHIKKYTLFYQKDGEGEPVLIAEGTEEVENGVLGFIPTERLTTGDYNLILTVEDIDGNSGSACGAFEYTEGQTEIETDLVAPEAKVTGLKLSDDGSTVNIRATAKDDKELKGYTLSYAKEGTEEYTELATGTEAIEDVMVSVLPTEVLEDGTYVLKLQAWDASGNSNTYTVSFVYQKGGGSIETGSGSESETPVPGGPVQKNFGLALSYSVANIGTQVQAQVTLPDNVSEDTVTITMNGKELATGTRKTTFSSETAGRMEITATGVTDEGEEVSATAYCTFFKASDKNPPTAAITSPTIDQVLTKPVDIVGTVTDKEGLDFWKLEYRLKGDEAYQLLAEGKTEKKDEVLAHFDTTMLLNGQYEVRLTVQDEGGNITKLENDYVVEGELKVGAMHIGFTDITAKMGGTTVSMNRMYDNRNKSQGDFGYGWTLGLQGMEIAESGNIAEGYQLVQSGSAFSTGYQMTETISHDVVVTYGDGTSDRFELTFTPERKALIPISEVKLGYKCVTNQKVKLEIVQDSTAYVPGTELSFYNEEMYGILDYKLTTEEGNEIYLNKKMGVYKIVDSVGNVITVDEDGYHSEDGKSITFTRDEEGRVVKAEDPTGKAICYEYDSAGDLVCVTDAAERTVTFTYDKKHNLASIIDPSGVAVARNEYDDAGRLIATIDADGNRTMYEHDVEGRTELITDRLGNKTLYIYDDNGNVLSATDANGNTTKSTYDSFGNVLTKTDANGNVTSYDYDENGNMTKVTDASGNSVKNVYNKDNLITSMKTVDDTEILIDYDENGLLSETTDAEGNTTSYINDRKGNVTGMADEIGTVMKAKYDKDGNVIETTDSAGNKTVNTFDDAGNRLTQTTYAMTETGTVERTTRYIYNDAGELVQTIDADGNSTSVERNANGQMSAATDSKGRRTQYSYDEFGNVSEVLYSDGTTETFEYDAEGRTTKTTSRTGLVTTYSYDKVGNLLTQTDARGNVTSYTYDKNYNVKTITSPTGAVTTYTYDELNRNTAIEDSEGNVTSFTYNALSLQTSTTDAKGNVTLYEHDKNGSPTKVIYADETYAETKYDERGRTIWQKDTAGRETEYTYDDSDRLVKVKQNHGAVTKYTYDQIGNLTSITDANGNTTTYVYDENSRRIKVILADGAESTSEYDSYGMLISSTDYNGVITTYSYDEEDRIIKETTGEEYTHYTYDSLGRLTDVETADSHISYTYNKYGELYYKTYENGQKVVYGYDQYGRNNEIRVTQNGKMLYSTKYEFDTMNRLTRVVGHDGTAVVYSYDANGNRETATYANGIVLTYTYDECNRLTLQKVVDKSGKAIAQYNYTLGEGGERTKVTEEGPEGTIETAYEYDKAGRLTKETIRKGEETTTYKYNYDAVGNRIEKRENGSITEYTYNSRNQLTEEDSLTGTVVYSYDANGNLLNQSGAGKASTYTYDVYNKLIQYVEGSKKERYSYDAEGVRRSKVNNDETIYYVSDTTGSLSYTLTETDTEGNLIASYTRADVLISQVRADELSYYLFDGHGDVRGLLDTEGVVTDTYRYNAYGELVESTGETENHYLYTGEYYDGTSNLYYLRARYMNPSTGTFISMDTYEGSIYDPDTLHKYLYANGNPVKYSDPSGNTFMSFMATTILTTLNNIPKLHVMGVISGVASSAITNFLGGSTDDVIKSFVVGYIGGFGMGAIMCVAAAYGAIVFAKIYLAVSFTNAIMTVAMMVYSIFKQKEKYVIVYAVLAIIALMNLYQAYSLYGSIVMTGDKGSITIGFDNNDPDNPTFDGKKIGETQQGGNFIGANKQTLLDALKEAPVEYRKNPRTGEMEPYMKQIQVTEDYKLILRRDIGDFNHGDLDHWNLEVQTIGGGNVKYDLHLYIGDDGNLLPFTEDNVYIPKKSPFH